MITEEELRLRNLEEKKKHLKYIEDYLLADILSTLPDETLESSETEHADGLDGFMSALYRIQLKTKTALGDIKERHLIAKFMKGCLKFRESSKSYTQFANEIFVYAKLLPAYDQLLKETNVSDVKVENWVAPAYITKFGYIEGLSATPEEQESVLVLEDLKPQGYRLGPRVFLHRNQLFNMCKVLAEYHALSYAMRELDPDQLTYLKSEIVVLPFVDENKPQFELPPDIDEAYQVEHLEAEENLYSIFFRAAFDRFFDYLNNVSFVKPISDMNKHTTSVLALHIRRIRKQYFDDPTQLLERLRTQIEDSEEDRRWAVILHGDFTRNNVLFAYKPSEKQEAADDDRKGVLLDVSNVKMVDFQELRYGSPAIDLSFFMYLNTPGSIRDEIWMQMLKKYHSHMFSTLSSVLKANKTDLHELAAIDEELENYSFGKFVAHFSRYAFYGVMKCMHFLSWMLCSDEECATLSDLFKNKMRGKEFPKALAKSGGDEVNARILKIWCHASKAGYLDHI